MSLSPGWADPAIDHPRNARKPILRPMKASFVSSNSSAASGDLAGGQSRRVRDSRQRSPRSRVLSSTPARQRAPLTRTAETTAFGLPARQPLRQGDQIRARFGEALAALALAGRKPLPLPRCRELCHEGRLLELRDGTEDLAHQDGSRRILDEEGRCARRNDADAPRPQHVVAGELHHEVTGEAVGALDEDRPRAVAHQLLEHFGEAGSVVDRVRAAHRRVVERLYDLVSRRLRVGFDRRALALLAVLVRADIYPARGPKISNKGPPSSTDHRRRLSVARNGRGPPTHSCQTREVRHKGDACWHKDHSIDVKIWNGTAGMNTESPPLTGTYYGVRLKYFATWVYRRKR